MMKHAILIIAHNLFDQLQLLVDALDDPRNDIFIHLDKKAGTAPALHSELSGLYVLDRRLDVRWMDVSLVECEMLLFREAFGKGPYEYYHLISGADLPVKSNDFIHSFCEERNGKEFVGFVDDSKSEAERVTRYHCFTRNYLPRRYAVRRFRESVEAVANLLVKKRGKGETVKKGAQWVSVTNNLVSYMLEREAEILKRYRHTRGSDEYFIQTLLWNSPLRENIYRQDDEYASCLRAIDWERGMPYTWGAEEGDLDTLKKSEALFARKFDVSRYPEIVNDILEMI